MKPKSTRTAAASTLIDASAVTAGLPEMGEHDGVIGDVHIVGTGHEKS